MRQGTALPSALGRGEGSHSGPPWGGEAITVTLIRVTLIGVTPWVGGELEQGWGCERQNSQTHSDHACPTDQCVAPRSKQRNNKV